MPAPLWHSEALKMRDEGYAQSDIARHFNVDRARISRLFATKPAISIPAWVKSLGLSEDYRDTAAISDEFAAAAHCRALKRNMGAPA
jgi:hypothetical protein